MRRAEEDKLERDRRGGRLDRGWCRHRLDCTEVVGLMEDRRMGGYSMAVVDSDLLVVLPWSTIDVIGGCSAAAE